MKTRLLLSILSAMPLFAVTCPSGATHIVDTLLTGDGVTQAYGKLIAKGPTAPSGSVLSTSLTITIGIGSPNVDFCLVGGPAVKYAATYLLTTSTGKATTSWSETWIVPATTAPLTIARLWGGSSAPQYLISPSQFNAFGLADGTYGLAVAGGAVTGMTPGVGGGGNFWSQLTSATWSTLRP